ncbi:PBP2_Bug_TTT domain containing protein [Burkholderiaceae bacterium]
MKRRTFHLSTFALWAQSTGWAWADESYPSKPVKVIVPYPAGGVVDLQTRAMTQGLSTELGQPVLVDSRPGANGNIAAEAVARSPADGYTLLVSAPYLINNPLNENNLRWAPKDFVPLARFSVSPSFMCVPTASPARTVRDYVDMARRAKPMLQFGDPGSGTTQTMSVQILKSTAGIEIEGIAYKGAPPLAIDLINNAFSMSVLPSSVAYPHIKSGKLRALATTSSARYALLPDVPTIAEAGYPEATVLSWYGIHVPSNTPVAVMRKLEAAIKAAVQKADTQNQLVSAGGEAAYLGTDDFNRFVVSDGQMWERINRMLRK